MATDVPREAIRSIVATLSGLPVDRIYWKGQAEKAVVGPFDGGKAGKITLNVVALAEGAGFEPRRSFDTDTLTEESGRIDQLTISMRADNFAGLGKAFDLLQSVRLKFAKLSSRGSAILKGAELAYLGSPSIVNLDYKVDNREVSAASMDILLAQAIATEGEAVPWIEKLTSKPGPTFSDEEVAALPVVDLAVDRD